MLLFVEIKSWYSLGNLQICIFNRRRQWHPTPVLLPGKSHGQRSLVGCSPWGRWGSDTTERLHFHFSLSCIGEGHGNPLQCSCLENPRDGGAWWAAVYGVAQNRKRLKWLSSSSSQFWLKSPGQYYLTGINRIFTWNPLSHSTSHYLSFQVLVLCINFFLLDLSVSKIQWQVFSCDFWLEWFQKIIIVEQGLLSYLLCDRSKAVTNSCINSIQFSSSVVSDSLQPHESQHTRPPCPSPTPRVHSNSTSIKSVIPSNHLILWHPLLLLPPIPPSIRVFVHLQWVNSSHEVDKVLEFQLQHQSFQWTPKTDLL